ncbi:hypothetical protein J4411_02005 [Candidatus Pacearchaeota archaeon]|nr:hypothetical protein [Candidatus Pacearchaeota archaeon]
MINIHQGDSDLNAQKRKYKIHDKRNPIIENSNENNKVESKIEKMIENNQGDLKVLSKGSMNTVDLGLYNSFNFKPTFGTLAEGKDMLIYVKYSPEDETYSFTMYKDKEKKQ